MISLRRSISKHPAGSPGRVAVNVWSTSHGKEAHTVAKRPGLEPGTAEQNHERLQRRRRFSPRSHPGGRRFESGELHRQSTCKQALFQKDSSVQGFEARKLARLSSTTPEATAGTSAGTSAGTTTAPADSPADFEWATKAKLWMPSGHARGICAG
jgi:hypothetical protein